MEGVINNGTNKKNGIPLVIRRFFIIIDDIILTGSLSNITKK